MNDNLELIREYIERTYDKVNNLIPIVASNPEELSLSDIDDIKSELCKALAMIKIEDNDTEESDSNTESNKDDLHEAIRALNTFTRNWCMNCTATDESGEPVFRCGECDFNANTKCLIKHFAKSHDSAFANEINFGCMS
jgi:hypothetical protein